MQTKFFNCLAGCALAVLLCIPAALAQTVTGSITGVVTDRSGAVIAGATVTARNIATGVDTPVTTNASGSYNIQFLPIGQYQVTVHANGFGTQEIPAFSLEIDQKAKFNVQLSAGSVTETVQVSAAAPILNTDDDTLASTFTANTIENFPLNGLDFSAVTLYVPGAVSTAGTSGTTSIERSTYYTDSINLNGNRAQANNYTLDGIDMNETFNNLISYSPAPDALEQIRVITADSPADYGNVNGAGVVSVLKSGTNRFHGSAYGYLQDYRLNANSWQNNNQGISINPFSQDQFGGTFGGPIKRDKLFFFVDYLGSRHHSGGIGSESVLTQAMRNGDFSVLLNGANPIQLYDALNNFAPYVGNKGVPITNPVATFLFANPKLYPLPNATPTDGIVNSNYQAPTRTFKANNQGDIKIEYDPRTNDKFTGFYSMSTAYDGTTPVLAISFTGVNLYPTKLFGTNWVHTFSPSLINSARIGFTRTVWAQNFPVDSTGQFGIAGNSKVGITFPDQAYNGFSYQNVGGGIFAGGNPVYGGGLIDNTYSYIDNLTWQRGRHLLSIGAQALRYQNNYPTANNNGYLGSLSYNGNYTKSPNDANSGYGGADFLLDRVSSVAATLASVNVGQRQWRVAGFINDDYKVLPNLTLNFGIRYEFDQPWIESNNKTGNVDEATGQVLYANSVPVGAPAGSGVCSNRACYDNNYRQIMPRVGFAYQVNDRLVVRGGYGATSFFEGNSSNQRLTSITPFIQAINVNLTQPTAADVPTPLNAETAFESQASAGGTFNVYPKNIQPAYVQEWNLTTEYALTRTLSLQVGYLGEQGQHIEDYGNLNQYLVNGDPTSAPYYNNQYIGVNSALGIGSNSLLVTESRAMMNFNGLEAVLRQRFSHGLEYTLNYTFSKSMTNSLGNYALNVNGFSGAFQNYYNSAADYGPAGYDVTHNVSGNAVYALPVGRGKEYLSGANRLLDEVVGGWKLAVAGVAYSGFPETLTTGVSSNSNSYGNERANQYRKLKIVHRSIASNWFGTDPSAQPCTTPGVDNGVCAFGAPANNTFGTSRNGAVRAPGYLNVDMSAFKDFHIIGEQAIGFRFDAFNAFNIVSYGNPDIGINDTGFGQIGQQNSIRSTERHLQFSAHYSF
jgi:Carboxypeptidase regulatory-like domain/TonB-dependent Receptor Plug Domain